MPQSDLLRERAAKCRRLALAADDAKTVQGLNALAVEYEAAAARLGAQAADNRRYHVVPIGPFRSSR
jgi:hypothetical protein